MTAEAKVQSEVVEYFRLCGGVAYRVNPAARRGSLDYVFLFPKGLAVVVEFKAPTGKLSNAQERELETLKHLEHRVLVIDSVIDGKEWVDAYLA